MDSKCDLTRQGIFVQHNTEHVCATIVTAENQ